MEKSEESLNSCYGSYRFRLAIIVMLMSMLGVSYRMSISFAIVCMVNHTAVHDLKVESFSHVNDSVNYEFYNETADSEELPCELQNVKGTLSLEVCAIYTNYLMHLHRFSIQTH